MLAASNCNCLTSLSASSFATLKHHPAERRTVLAGRSCHCLTPPSESSRKKLQNAAAIPSPHFLCTCVSPLAACNFFPDALSAAGFGGQLPNGDNTEIWWGYDMWNNGSIMGSQSRNWWHFFCHRKGWMFCCKKHIYWFHSWRKPWMGRFVLSRKPCVW